MLGLPAYRVARRNGNVPAQEKQKNTELNRANGQLITTCSSETINYPILLNERPHDGKMCTAESESSWPSPSLLYDACEEAAPSFDWWARPHGITTYFPTFVFSLWMTRTFPKFAYSNHQSSYITISIPNNFFLDWIMCSQACITGVNQAAFFIS